MIRRLYRFLFKNPPKAKSSIRFTNEKHGGYYGSFTIKSNSLNDKSIVYSFGIGDDVSFDLSIINKYGCEIFAFDPTPKVENWVNENVKNNKFRFFPVGLAAETKKYKFFIPSNPENISHKILPQSNDEKFIELNCKSISDIMLELGHEKIDLIKMDIEGFEYEVLKKIIEDKIKVNQIVVEFHHFFKGFNNKATEDCIKMLENHGFKLFNIQSSFCEYSFINSNY